MTGVFSRRRALEQETCVRAVPNRPQTLAPGALPTDRSLRLTQVPTEGSGPRGPPCPDGRLPRTAPAGGGVPSSRLAAADVCSTCLESTPTVGFRVSPDAHRNDRRARISAT